MWQTHFGPNYVVGEGLETRSSYRLDEFGAEPSGCGPWEDTCVCWLAEDDELAERILVLGSL